MLSLLAGLLIALPVLPASDAGPIVAMNPDVGETIGWPELVRTVARVADQVRPLVHGHPHQQLRRGRRT